MGRFKTLEERAGKRLGKKREAKEQAEKEYQEKAKEKIMASKINGSAVKPRTRQKI